jgi:hypothetical protein
MKAAAAFFILALAAGIASSALGQSSGDHALSLPGPGSYSTTNTGIGTNSKNANGADASGAPSEGKPVEEDESLYRGKTSEMESSMMRDEGMLHFKTRPKEKAQEIDSKKLFTSGADPKFQGSFITSGVSPIDKIGQKATETREAPTPAPEVQGDPAAAPAPEVQGAPGHPRRHMTFDPEKTEDSKKAESGSSPSPTASPSASPAKNSGNSKQ